MSGINEVDSSQSNLENNEIESNKQIVSNLLIPFVGNSMDSFFVDLEEFVKQLNHSQDLKNENFKIQKTLYAIKFEEINLVFGLAETKSVIYSGFGLDLNMQKIHLGYWYKSSNENYYKFWLRVFKDIKDLGTEDILFNCSDNQYWISEALNSVYRTTEF